MSSATFARVQALLLDHVPLDLLLGLVDTFWFYGVRYDEHSIVHFRGGFFGRGHLAGPLSVPDHIFDDLVKVCGMDFVDARTAGRKR